MLLKHTIKRVPWLTGLLRCVRNETIVRLRDRKAYARWKLMKSLRMLSSLIVSEKMAGGNIEGNGDYYIRTHDDLYLYYNYGDNRFTLGDGQSLDFRPTYTEVFFERFIERLSGTLKTYIDVGANNGYWYSLKVAKRIPGSRVYAFEPDKMIFPHLTRNVEYNQLTNITIIPQALSSVAGMAKMTDGLGASGYLVTSNADRASTVDVECTTLDRFIKQYGIENIDLLKVDIEGGEFSFLSGAKESLVRFKPLMLLELLDSHLRRSNSSMSDVVSFLIDIDYNCYRIKGSNDVLCVPKSKPGLLEARDCEMLEAVN